MGGVFSKLIFGMVLILGPNYAFASGEKAKCSDAAKKAGQECTDAAKGAESAGDAHNAGGTAQDGAHGGQGDRGSGNLCPRLQNQKQNLDAAKGKCAAAKQKCTQT